MLNALFGTTEFTKVLAAGNLFGVVDVELTNRCNASCTFCPRDVTPHQGVMSDEVFQQSLARVVELRRDLTDVLPKPLAVSFCGLGEQLLNPHLPSFVEQTRAQGLSAAVNTNGSLLDERRARDLLDVGLDHLFVNGGEIGEDYEAVYHLPFHKVRDNVARFVEMAGDDCAVYIVLVDHRGDPERGTRAAEFWRSLGVRRFFRFPLQNRGGSLDVEGMAYLRSPHLPAARARAAELGIDYVCGAPFHFPFVGYDGQYYLCSSDWKKEASVGDVFADRILDTFAARLGHVRDRDAICATCTHDAVNQIATLLARREAGEIDDDEVALVEQHLVLSSECVRRATEALGVAPPPVGEPRAVPSGVAPWEGRARPVGVPLTVVG